MKSYQELYDAIERAVWEANKQGVVRAIFLCPSRLYQLDKQLFKDRISLTERYIQIGGSKVWVRGSQRLRKNQICVQLISGNCIYTSWGDDDALINRVQVKIKQNYGKS